MRPRELESVGFVTLVILSCVERISTVGYTFMETRFFHPKLGGEMVSNLYEPELVRSVVFPPC